MGWRMEDGGGVLAVLGEVQRRALLLLGGAGRGHGPGLCGNALNVTRGALQPCPELLPQAGAALLDTSLVSAVVVGMAWARASPLRSLCCLPQAGNHECWHGKPVTSSPSPSRCRETALSPWSARSPSPSDTESSSPGAGTPAHTMAGAVLGPTEALLSSSSPASRSGHVYIPHPIAPAKSRGLAPRIPSSASTKHPAWGPTAPRAMPPAPGSSEHPSCCPSHPRASPCVLQAAPEDKTTLSKSNIHPGRFFLCNIPHTGQNSNASP